MSAGRYDTIIEQGATFSRTITWKDSSGAGIDLTNYTIAGKIKKKVSDKTALLSFTVTEANQGSLPGQFTISLTATQTSSLPATYSQDGSKESLELYYDLEATNGSSVTRIVEGILYNSPEVTR